MRRTVHRASPWWRPRVLRCRFSPPCDCCRVFCSPPFKSSLYLFRDFLRHLVFIVFTGSENRVPRLRELALGRSSQRLITRTACTRFLVTISGVCGSPRTGASSGSPEPSSTPLHEDRLLSSAVSSIPSGTACSTDFQGAGIRARDGTLWFATQDGVAVIDPITIPIAPPSPLLHTGTACWRATAHDLGQTGRARCQGAQLHPRLHALHFRSPEQVRFLHRLAARISLLLL